MLITKGVFSVAPAILNSNKVCCWQVETRYTFIACCLFRQDDCSIALLLAWGATTLPTCQPCSCFVWDEHGRWQKSAVRNFRQSWGGMDHSSAVFWIFFICNKLKLVKSFLCTLESGWQCFSSSVLLEHSYVSTTLLEYERITLLSGVPCSTYLEYTYIRPTSYVIFGHTVYSIVRSREARE